MQIQGSVAVVSGGASGLGEATVRRLSAAGARCLIADLNADRGKALADELGGAFAQTDVSDADQVQAAVAQAAELGPVRAAISCAGIGWVGRVINRDNSPHDLMPFQKVIEVNVIGTFNMMRFGASAIAASEPNDDGERGVLVNTASVAAFDGQTGQLAYSASKGGIVGMTLPAARDLAPVGIRVITIAPGLMDTPLLGLLGDEGKAKLAADVIFPKRLGAADDYAALVQHIAENPYLNGETIRLDGAIRLPPK
ncbi:MAG: SDR family NAD(P)-dependent oxidoreductase [Acidimicrobiia bacterium]|nr:SDR family NAD(P)-dependent oxidoreductase [Acidimicrobiia bacterium]